MSGNKKDLKCVLHIHLKIAKLSAKVVSKQLKTLPETIEAIRVFKQCIFQFCLNFIQHNKIANKALSKKYLKIHIDQNLVRSFFAL